MRRLFITLGILVFLGISTLLARAFGADGAEHSAISALVQAEGRGDSAAVVAQLLGCAGQASCRARVQTLSATLRRVGKVEVLKLDPSTSFSLGGSTGIARVAWNTARQPRPVVQCLQVRRAGNVLRGLHIELLKLTGAIKSDSECPHTI